MKMKKMTALLLACLMIMSLVVGCGSSGEAESAGDEAKVYNIGIVQQLEHPALDAASQGFIDACNELFGEGNWDLTYAYADHYSDIPLLEFSQHPIAVSPGPALERYAKKRNWHIVEW